MALQLPGVPRWFGQVDFSPIQPIQKPTWGPPDMAEQLQKGIAGIGTAFEGAYERARARGVQDQLSEYYKTHPLEAPGFAGGAGGGGGGTAGAGGGGSRPPIDNNPFKTDNPVASNLKPHEAALLNGIAGPESNGAYNVRFGGEKGPQHFDSFDRHPGIFEKGPAGPSSAAGRYQFTKTTWDKVMGADTPFTPENQDIAALRLARQDYNGRTGRDLDSDLIAEGFSPRIQAALKPTWAGLAGGNTGRVGSTFTSTLGSYKPIVNQNVQLPSQPQAPEGVAPGAMAAAGSARPTQTNLPGVFADSSQAVRPVYDPKQTFGRTATAEAQPFNSVVLHHTATPDLDSALAISRGDPKRGGNAFGYHFYVDRDGSIIQGAPLTARTNHVKGNAELGVSNRNAIGVSLVGNGDDATPEQIAAAKQLTQDLEKRFKIGNDRVFGHGQLQPGDKEAGEGLAVLNALRGQQRADVPAAGARPTGLVVNAANQPAAGARGSGGPGPEGAFVVPGTGQRIPAPGAAGPLPPPRPASLPGPQPGQVAPAPPPQGPTPQQPAGGAPVSRNAQALFHPQGGDSVYAATADYQRAQQAGLVPPQTAGLPAGPGQPPAPPPGPVATGSLPPAGAVVPQAAPAAAPPPQGPQAPQQPPQGYDPAASAAKAEREFVEPMARELVKQNPNMSIEDARTRVRGATWDDKGFRLGPGLGEPGAAPPPAAAPAGAPAGGGGTASPAPLAGNLPAGAPRGGPGGGAPGGQIAGQPSRVFQPHEALAIAARGDPAVFNAMLREYGPNGAANKGFTFHEVNGELWVADPRTGQARPVGGSAKQQNVQTVTADGQAWERLPDGSWRKIGGGPGNVPGKDQLAGETGLRKEFEEKIKDYRTVSTAMGRIEEAKEDPSGSGDMALMYSWLKILDPETGIREGEYATVQNAGSLPERWTAQYNSILKGEKLDPGVRADIVNRARALTANRSAQAAKDAEFYQGQARRYGFDPPSVTGSFKPYQMPDRARSDKPAETPAGITGKGTEAEPYRMPPGTLPSEAYKWITTLKEGTRYIDPTGKPHTVGVD